MRHPHLVVTGPNLPVMSASRAIPLALSLLLAASSVLLLASSTPGVRAQIPTPDTGPYTRWTSVIEYQTSSGFTPDNVNITWTNTNDCGSFGGDGPGATWYYAPGVGATPCTSPLPTGTITETITADGTVLAGCTDTRGAATYGNPQYGPGGSTSIPSECSTSGAGVTINIFSAQAYDASGNPIAASSGGNDYWIIAVVLVILIIIIIIIIIILLFYLWRKKKGPFARMQAPPVAAGTSPAPASQAGGTSYCAQCGHALDAGASFCRSCGAKAS